MIKKVRRNGVPFSYMIKTIGYILTPQIQMRANFIVLRRKISVITYIFYPVIIILSIILMTYEPDRWELPLLIIAYMLLRPVMVYRNLRQASGAAYNKAVDHIVSFEINDNGISELVDNSPYISIPWNDVDKAIKGRDYYLLIAEGLKPFYIPEKAFSNKEDLASFENILESRYLTEK